MATVDTSLAVAFGDGSVAGPVATIDPTAPAPPARAPAHLAASPSRFGRDALFLAGSSAILAVSGFAFWAVAARRMSPGELAGANALISIGVFIGGVAQMNLVGSLPALLPTVGRRGPRLLLRCYAAAAAVAVAMALALEIVGNLAPSVPHVEGPGGIAFIVAIALWTTFSIQDAALAATQQAGVVPIENTIYSLLRIALLVALVDIAPLSATLIAWFAPIILLIPVVNYLIVRKLRRSVPVPAISGTSSRRLLGADALASTFTQAQSRLVPFVAVLALDGLPAAELAMAWLFWTTADVFLGNLNVPLTVAVTRSGGALDHDVRKGQRLGLGLTGLGVLAGCVVAAPLLELVLPDATADGVLLVRLTLLSLVPRALYHVALAVARGERHVRHVLILPIEATVLLYGCMAVGLVLDDLRLIGIGVLLSQVVLAVVAERWRRHRPRPNLLEDAA